MLLPRLGALLLAAQAVSALKNSSPFLLLSSDPLPSDAPLKSAQLALASDVEDRLINTLQACDKKHYYIFSQEHVAPIDFREGGMSRLRRRVAGADEGTVVQIAEVSAKGELSAQSVQARLELACLAKGKKGVSSWPEAADEYRIITMDLPAPPTDAKRQAIRAMKDTDDALDDTVASVLGAENTSVLIYITSPRDLDLYEMEESYSEALHTDLKRNLGIYARQTDSDNPQAGLPLFEKYQFFTPGIFMGLLVTILLFVILYTAIGAIANLQVSYMAFNKEMGPQGKQGKQQ